MAAVGVLLFLTAHITLISHRILSEENLLQMNLTLSGFIRVPITLVRQFSRILESIFVFSDIREIGR